MNYQEIPFIDGFTITNVLTPEECKEWAAKAETEGYAASGVKSIFAGNRLRVCFVDDVKASVIWSRIAPFVKEREHHKKADLNGEVETVPWGKYKPVGINPLLRCSKYLPGGDFRLHHDTCYARDKKYVGFMTILIYLNDNFEGGETVIFENMTHEPHAIIPETGKIFAFYHYQGHSGMQVKSGNKLVVRSEIMYSKID